MTDCAAANFLPAKSTQKFIRGCAAQTHFLPNPNTPQSPAATAPLLKRGQPLREQTAVQKKAKYADFQFRRLLPSRSTRDTFLPEEGT